MDEIIGELMKVFVTEAKENLARIEEGVLQLERAPEDIDTAQTVFRAAHSLKGDASCVGAEGVVALAHAAEELMERVVAGHLRFTPELTTILLRCVDALETRVADKVAGRDGAGPGDRELIDEVLRAAQGDAEAMPSQSDPDEPLPAAQTTVRRSVRVDMDRLDEMLDLTSELTIARGRVLQMCEAGEPPARILEAFRESDQIHADLQERITRARMVPLGPLFRHFLRSTRDLAAAHGKLVELVIEGGDVELDARAVEALRDPLTHLIRNAIDHGVETPEERLRLGKPAGARIRLAAAHEGTIVVLTVSDEGRGLDLSRILQRARERGIVPESHQPSDRELLALIFRSGFSTAPTVTDLSGRGVGLDIVRRSIESLRGTVEAARAPEGGALFTIRLPLTLAMIEGFVVEAGEQTYVLPLADVLECRELHATDRERTTDVLELRERPVPYVRLRRLYDSGAPPPEREFAVIVRRGTSVAGIAVDGLRGTSQVVIKPLSRMCRSAAGISGSAVLGNGTIALILDTGAVLREVHEEELHEALSTA